jgi:phosphoribosylformylglycinamidine synthase
MFAALRELRDRGLLLAYHDRSDGGVLISVLEMAFASHLDFKSIWARRRIIAACFAEGLGAVPQVPRRRRGAGVAARHGLAPYAGYRRAAPESSRDESMAGWPIPHRGSNCIAAGARCRSVQELRDNPECAREEFCGSPTPPIRACASWRYDPAGYRGALYLGPAVAIVCSRASTVGGGGAAFPRRIDAYTFI